MIMYYDMDMVQVNDGLTQTAACSTTTVYDKKNGLVFVSYMTGLPKAYGEATGKICLSVFSPSQPENVRHRVIDTGVGKSHGFYYNAIYLVGDAKVRMLLQLQTENWRRITEIMIFMRIFFLKELRCYCAPMMGM